MAKEASFENSFFSFLCHATQHMPRNHPLTLACMACYVALLIPMICVSQLSATSLANSVFSSPIIVIVVSSIMVAMILQLIIGSLYMVHFQLYHQLTIYRYILNPILLTLLASQIYNPRHLSVGVSSVLMLLALGLVYQISGLFLQPLTFKRLMKNSINLSKYLTISEFFLVLTAISQQNVTQLYLLVSLWVCFASLFMNIPRLYDIEDYAFTILSFVYLQQYLFILTLIGKDLFFTNNSTLQMLLFMAPLSLILFVHRLLAHRQNFINSKLFATETSIEQFYDFVTLLIVELQRFNTTQNIKFQTSLLMDFITVHRPHCRNPSSPLLQSSTLQQLKECSESSNVKILVHKVLKAIEQLFENYLKKFANQTLLKILLKEFYVKNLQNKLKIVQLNSELNSHTFSWQERLVIFNLSYLSEELPNTQNMDVSRGQGEFDQFNKQMVATVTCLLEFWDKISQEKVDLSVLEAISAKLFPLKKNIETKWKQHLNSITFQSWKILSVYAQYRKKILNDTNNARILQDYCHILEVRLRDKNQLRYINTQTEKGVISISLSESSLGNISNFNEQCANMFKYNRAQLLKLRVNEIMPNCFAVLHDNILTSFLKNRWKSINTDERSLFGKNKNHFIFPYHLQLRQLSWNHNDELIFIANTLTVKLRASPIYCMIDHEGDIQEYTSTFAWMFMKKVKNNNQIKKKNIQEIIPGFFQIVETQKAKEIKYFVFAEKCVAKRHCQEIAVSFTAEEMFLRGQKMGFLVKGTNEQLLSSVNSQRNINTLLRGEHTFQYKQLAFEIPNKIVEPRPQSRNLEFTIPYLKTSDIRDIFTYKPNSKNYAQKIITLRLLNNRLQRVGDQDSFNTENSNEDWRANSVMRKMQKIKDEIGVSQNQKMVMWIRIIIILIAFLMVGLGSKMLMEPSLIEAQKRAINQNFGNITRIRQIIPEIIIYRFYPLPWITPVNIQNIQTFMAKRLSTSPHQQIQKEIFLKAFNDAKKGIPPTLPSDIFDYEIPTISNSYPILYLLLSAAFIYLIIAVAIFLCFKNNINSLYSALVSINSTKLAAIQSRSKALLNRINKSRTQQSQSLQRLQESNQQPFERMKKIKNSYSSEDIALLLQIMIPFVLILVLSAVFSGIIISSISQYDQKMISSFQSTTVMYESSVKLMQKLMKKLKLADYKFNSNYDQAVQQYESSLLLNFQSPILIQTLKDDPCTNAQLFKRLESFSPKSGAKFQRQLCNNSSLMQKSLSNLINFIYTTLSASQQKLNSSSYQIDWTYLISSQYRIVKMYMRQIYAIFKSILQQKMDNIKSLFIIFSISLLILTLISALYLLSYPIKSISEKLTFTKDLMSLMPKDQENRPVDALNAITTEIEEQNLI